MQKRIHLGDTPLDSLISSVNLFSYLASVVMIFIIFPIEGSDFLVLNERDEVISAIDILIESVEFFIFSNSQGRLIDEFVNIEPVPQICTGR